jgi:hypothetical protein
MFFLAENTYDVQKRFERQHFRWGWIHNIKTPLWMFQLFRARGGLLVSAGNRSNGIYSAEVQPRAIFCRGRG